MDLIGWDGSGMFSIRKLALGRLVIAVFVQNYAILKPTVVFIHFFVA